MAYLVRARERRDEIVLQLDIQIKARDAWVDKEAKAAQTVQTRFRSAHSRRKFRDQKNKAAFLQRIYRGYEGRCKAHAQKKVVETAAQTLMFDYFAEVIQRIFRGFRSRKVKHDFHARKKYIADMVSNSEQLQARLNKVAEEEAAKAAQRAKEERDRKMKETTTHLHYLVSTTAQRGVLNSPYAAPPTIDNVPVEKVISNNVREYLRAHKLDVKKHKPKVKFTGSVRTSSPFDVAEERMRQERKWSKLKQFGQKDFLAGTKPKEPQYTRGISGGSPFIEPRQLKLSTKEIMAKQRHKFMSKKTFKMAVKTGRLFDED